MQYIEKDNNSFQSRPIIWLKSAWSLFPGNALGDGPMIAILLPVVNRCLI